MLEFVEGLFDETTGCLFVDALADEALLGVVVEDTGSTPNDDGRASEPDFPAFNDMTTTVTITAIMTTDAMTLILMFFIERVYQRFYVLAKQKPPEGGFCLFIKYKVLDL